MEQKICDYVKTCPEPTFFHHPDDQALQEAHEELKRTLEEATETITIEVDLRLFQRAEKVLEAIGWTMEEALLLFLYWCISCPEQLAIWAKKHGIENEAFTTETGSVTLQQNALNTYTEACGDAGPETDEGETQCTTSPETPTETSPASSGSVNASTPHGMT